LLAVVVALTPGVVYAPVPRVVLLILVAILPAVLISSEASTKFKINTWLFVLSASGLTAVFFGVLFAAYHFMKPDVQIAVYYVFDNQRNHNPVDVSWGDKAVVVQVTQSGLRPSVYRDGNALVMIFPEQVEEADVYIRRSPSARPVRYTLRYAGTRKSELFLGK
jgi:hypothetical protein